MFYVLLYSRRLSEHSVFLVVTGCLGPCLCALVLASLVRARGLAFSLGVCLLGFPAVVCTVTPFPTISSLCYKEHRRLKVAVHHIATYNDTPYAGARNKARIHLDSLS